jgi:hypothetical protein
MASRSQIQANRRNALMSTGPKTEAGKSRSRSNAVRHGLTAETVIELLEDPEDYKAFQLSVASDFDAQTAVERELVLRLAGLLWRLRRATAIETGMLQIHSDTTVGLSVSRPPRPQGTDGDTDTTVQCGDLASTIPPDASRDPRDDDELTLEHDRQQGLVCAAGAHYPTNAIIARGYLRLAKFDHGAFERLSRYETALWRQVAQILFTLGFLQRRG